MAENLNVMHNSSNGNSACYYNQESNCGTYGRLYDWATAMNLPSSCNSSSCASQVSSKHRGICPEGWHIPSDEEWTTLTNYVGGFSTAGTKLKSTSGWNSYSGVPAGTDSYGFAALPGGYNYADVYVVHAGDNGYWWSSFEGSTSGAYGRTVGYDYEDVRGLYNSKTYLHSVRCLQDSALPSSSSAPSSSSSAQSSSSAAQISSSSVAATYTVTYNANGGAGAPASQTKTQGIALTLSTATPTRTGYAFINWNTAQGGTGTSYAAGASYTANANATLYAQWTAVGYTGSYGKLSYEGQSYKTVVIGTQTWMAENLNVAHNSGNGNSVCYNNQESYCNTYGRLYNWAAAMDLPSSCNSSSCASQVSSKHQGICPSGWHIPSDEEWDVLVKYVDPNWTSNEYSSNIAGTKLKSTNGWDSYSSVPAGTDEFGFAALPGGYDLSGGYYSYLAGRYGLWWSSSEYSAYNAYFRIMSYSYEHVGRSYSYEKTNLHSVRCLQDNAP
jgi:uncharacterized protein (TIGR02145 family)/uncharacterized repeat protein (TIGR02543 family)